MVTVNQYRQSDNYCSTVVHGFVLIGIAASIALLFYLSVSEILAQNFIQSHTSDYCIGTCIVRQEHVYF